MWRSTIPPVGRILLSPSILTAGATTPATVTVTGDRFVTTSVAQVNGTARATTYVNASTLTFLATVADQASVGTLGVTVTNPAPGGGTSPVANLSVTQPGEPSITSVSPNSFTAGAPDTGISIIGTGFAASSQVEWNGAPRQLRRATPSPRRDPLPCRRPISPPRERRRSPSAARIPLDRFPTPCPNITNPLAPDLTVISPNAGPVKRHHGESVGSGPYDELHRSSERPSDRNRLCEFVSTHGGPPSHKRGHPGNLEVTVVTPAPGGGTSSPLAYTTYIQMPNNDIVYNPTDGLLYVSVPISAGSVSGNSVVGMDPATGNVMRQIWVGSNPIHLQLFDLNGTQLFVGLDGAGAVAQVDLTQGKCSQPVFPGRRRRRLQPALHRRVSGRRSRSTDSVAVAVLAGSFSGGTGVTTFDSGVARANPSSGVGYGPVSFGSSASTLYMAGTSVDQLTVNSSGISAATDLSSVSW